MTPEDRRQFVTLIEVLTGGFGLEPNEAMLNAFWGGLVDLPMADVKEGIRAAMRTCERMPRPAHIRKLVGKGELGPEHRAPLAWQAVRDALSRYGTYNSVQFDDPVTNATIRSLGGWVGLGQKSAEDFEVWTRKDFERLYVVILRAGSSESAVAYLPGISEKENAGLYEVKPPIRIPSALPPPKFLVRPSPQLDKLEAQNILKMIDGDGYGKKGTDKHKEKGECEGTQDQAPPGGFGVQGDQSGGESGRVRFGDDETRVPSAHTGEVKPQATPDRNGGHS